MKRKLTIRDDKGKPLVKVEDTPKALTTSGYKPGEFNLIPMFSPALSPRAGTFFFRGLEVHRPEECADMLLLDGHESLAENSDSNDYEYNVWFGTWRCSQGNLVDFAIGNIRYAPAMVMQAVPNMGGGTMLTMAIRRSFKCRFGNSNQFTARPNVVYLGYRYR